jgi:hypothetical protein
MKKDRSEMTTTELFGELDKTLRRTRRGVSATGRAVESMETILRRARQVDYIMGKEPHIEPFQ